MRGIWFTRKDGARGVPAFYRRFAFFSPNKDPAVRTLEAKELLSEARENRYIELERGEVFSDAIYTLPGPTFSTDRFADLVVEAMEDEMKAALAFGDPDPEQVKDLERRAYESRVWAQYEIFSFLAFDAIAALKDDGRDPAP